ncbi:MAG: hypothetical protein FJ291_28335, partial [Planctomycetes bacterium]|nr:hypothetical protein [Planctomycetota bacterium]
MCTGVASVTGLLLLAGLALGAQLAPNPSFEQGDVEPLGWRLEGKGAWEKAGRSGERSVSVTGDGKDSGFWRTTALAFDPGALYRVAFWTKGEAATGGCGVSGPSFANRDFSAQPGWQRHAFAFVAPNDTEGAYLRFGHWQVKGKVLFDDIELKPTQAVHERFGPGGGAAGVGAVVVHVGGAVAPIAGQPAGIVLGEGEEIVGNRYTFAAPLAGEGANHSRPLHTFRCGFNSNRWCFHDKAEVVCKHIIPGHQHTAATIEANCNYHASGKGFIDVSTNSADWATIATFEKVGRLKADVPKNLLPASILYTRLRAAGKEADTLRSKPGDFQIDDYLFTSTLDADLGEMRGATAYLDIQVSDPAFPVTVLSLPSAAPGSCWTVSINNLAGVQAKFGLKATVTDESGREVSKQGGASVSASVSIAVGGVGPGVPPPIAETTMQMSAGEPLRHPGTNTVTLIVTADGREVFRASALRKLPVLHDASYGYALPSDATCPLWWCEGPYKVSRSRPVPTAQLSAILIAAARNEYEPFQLVLRPEKDLRNVRIQCTSLVGDHPTRRPIKPGPPFDGRHIRVERVEY